MLKPYLPLILVGLLVSALGGTFALGHRTAKSTCEAKAEAAADRARTAVLEQRLGIINELATRRLEDEDKLRELREALATREVEVRTVYRERIREVEVPACAVAPEQVNAINEVLR